jgi:death-on-curing family protein
VLGAAAQEAVSSGNVTPGGLVTAGVLGVLAHKAGNVRRPETAGPSSVRPGVSPHHDPSDGLGPPKKAEDTSSGANANASQTHRELHAGAHSSDQPAAVQKEPQGSEHTAAQTSGHNAAESTSAPETKHLTADDILKKYEEMFPGQDGLRDLGLLEGAVARTKTAEYYEQADVNRQAAYLFKGLADNHAFHDGNKRITVQSVREFLQSNGKDLGQTTDMQLFELCDRMVAEKWSVDRTEAELSKFISSGISK